MLRHQKFEIRNAIKPNIHGLRKLAVGRSSWERVGFNLLSADGERISAEVIDEGVVAFIRNLVSANICPSIVCAEVIYVDGEVGSVGDNQMRLLIIYAREIIHDILSLGGKPNLLEGVEVIDGIWVDAEDFG